MPGGQPTKYKERYCEDIITYFQNDKVFPTLAGFAAEIGVCKDSLLAWAENNEEFSGAIKKAKAIQEQNLVSGALSGKHQSTFSIFFAKNNLGYKDKTEVDHSSEQLQSLLDTIDGKTKEFKPRSDKA